MKVVITVYCAIFSLWLISYAHGENRTLSFVLQACQNDNLDIIKNFVAIKQSNLNKEIKIKGIDKPVSLLCLASNANSTNIVKYLASQPDIKFTSKKNGLNALHLAAIKGHNEIIQILLNYKSKININEQDENDSLTALTHAAYNGHDAVVTSLLEAGASIFMKGKEGTTALNLAIIKGHRMVVKILLQHQHASTLVNQNCQNGILPLTMAARCGRLEIVYDFIAAGATTRVGDALHEAIKFDHGEIITILLSAGVDINALSTQCGRSPLSIAILLQQNQTAKFLHQCGAKIKARHTAPVVDPIHYLITSDHEIQHTLVSTTMPSHK